MVVESGVPRSGFVVDGSIYGMLNVLRIRDQSGLYIENKAFQNHHVNALLVNIVLITPCIQGDSIKSIVCHAS